MSPPLRIGSMCTGYGGLDMAVQAVLGGELAWCAESDKHAAAVIAARYPGVPNLGDLTAVDWRTIAAVDLVTAGFPCQDISLAGRGAGIRKDTRSGLWLTIADALRHLRPPHLFLENVAALRTRGLDQVLGDLAHLGYDTDWMCLRASDIGAPHQRNRMFLLARQASSHSADGNPHRTRPGGSAHERSSGVAGGRGLLAAAPHTDGPQLQRLRTSAVLAGASPTPIPPPADAPVDRHPAPAHPQGLRHRHPRPPGWPGVRAAAVGGPAAHTQSVRGDQGQPAPVRQPRQPEHDQLSDPPGFGVYTPAIRRWEAILGRPAPCPTELGRSGQLRLNPAFVEWIMGLPEGFVTDIDLPRNAHMRILGNGVVPQQATAALSQLCIQAGQELA